jgi:hypothetical protein
MDSTPETLDPSSWTSDFLSMANDNEVNNSKLIFQQGVLVSRVAITNNKHKLTYYR